MSLFKINRGNEVNLPGKLTDGWAYFCTDTGSFLIDHYDSTNTLVRSKINAEHTDKIRYVQNEEPVDVPDGTLWIDLDAKEIAGSGSSIILNDYATKEYVENLISEIMTSFVRYDISQYELTDEQRAQARENIGAVTLNDVLAALPTWQGGSY